MEKKERIREIYNAIKSAIDNREVFVIIENPESGKFVQFAIEHDEKIMIMDIPLTELTTSELDKLKTEVGEEGAYLATGELITIQKSFKFDVINEASQMVEKIFIEIFNLSEDYRIILQIFS